MFPLKRIHFIGIGGAGMSAIAWVLLGKGIPVSGSDLQPNARTSRLEENGALVYYGHSQLNLSGVGLVIVSSAIGEQNPELIYARRLKLPVWHRSRMLAEILDEGNGIVVAGTHGKTTTTSMVSVLLEKAGLDPTVLIGGELDEFGGNAKLGAGDYVVAEADESDGSFLAYSPQYAIVTNVELDHHDFYETPHKLHEAFRSFLAQVQPTGAAVLCADDAGLRTVLDKDLACEAYFYSLISPQADFFATEISTGPGGSTFTMLREGRKLGCVELSVPGRHNVSNALAAMGLGLILGVDFDVLRSAIRDFRGTKRRFQVKGETEGIMVIDDYAHHPSEVAATLRAAIPLRNQRNGRIVTIFQPHRYTRTLALADGFADAFNDSDIVIITDVYSAGEKLIPGVSGKMIYDTVSRQGHRGAAYVADPHKVCERLAGFLAPGDIVFTMGAGDIWRQGEILLKRLGEHNLEPASVKRAAAV